MQSIFLILMVFYSISFISYFLTNKFIIFGDKYYKSTLGFVSGVIISILCFIILPQAFKIEGVYLPIIGMILGVLVATYIDVLNKIDEQLKICINNLVGIGLIILLSRIISNVNLISSFEIAFIGGFIIYNCCLQIMPYSRTCNSKLSIFSSCVGFILGIILL